jgi:hypothetical protein
MANMSPEGRLKASGTAVPQQAWEANTVSPRTANEAACALRVTTDLIFREG